MGFNTLPGNSAQSTGNIGSSVGYVRLAPDLDFTARQNSIYPYESVLVDPSGSLTTMLSLTGKFAVFFLEFQGLPTAENSTIKVTVDGTVIYNETETRTGAAASSIWGELATSAFAPFIVNQSMLVECETVTDPAVTLYWRAVPIL